MNYIVTIDGPSGVGKTSLGSLLAQEYNSNFFQAENYTELLLSISLNTQLLIPVVYK